jgi:ABC-type glycerol-3-phosphate transport system substrate-binding protein
MKLKLLPVILASFMLGACGGNEPAPSSSVQPASSTSEPVKWTYLGHRMGILGCSTAEMKMSLDC